MTDEQRRLLAEIARLGQEIEELSKEPPEDSILRVTPAANPEPIFCPACGTEFQAAGGVCWCLSGP